MIEKRYLNERNLKTSTYFMIFIIFIGLISVIYQMFAKNIVYEKLGFKAKWFLNSIVTDDNFDEPERKNNDWCEKYAFYDKGAYTQVKIINKRISGNNSSGVVGGKVGRLYSMLEKYTSDYFSFRDICERFSKQFNNILGYKINTDAYGVSQLFLANGHMTYERLYKPMDNETTNIKSFSEWLKSKGIDYFHVEIPDPVDPMEEPIVWKRGYRVFSNRMADELTTNLKKLDIDCIDLREDMLSENKLYTDYFFKYEHHLVPEAGLWAAGRIAEHIKGVSGCDFEEGVFDLNQYDVSKVSKYSDWLNDKFIVYKGCEDLDLLSPKYRTDFRKYIADYDIELNGSFDDVMYATWELPTYNTWNHGIKAIKTYRNKNLPVTQPKILLLTESYSDVITPFLACSYANIDEIDLRIFSGSLQRYIEETKPDLVISIYSAYELGASGTEELFMFE